MYRITGFILTVITSLTLFASASVHGQTTPRENQGKDRPVAKTLELLVREKLDGRPFRLMTSAEMAEFADASGSDPCTVATPINVGDIRYGGLGPGDCRLTDNSYADFYSFSGTAGQQVPIFLSSLAFDTYAGIANDSGSYTVEDDDSGAGTDSYILATLPATETYFILANSALPNQFGEYTLSLSSSPYCAYAINPTSADVAPAGGIYTFEVQTQAGCPWQAYTPPSYFITSGTVGSGPGVATYTIGPNGDTPRSGIITLVPGFSPVPAPNIVFTVNQAPLICNYSISSTGISIPGASFQGSFNITAPDGCFWMATSPDFFISSNSQGRGNGTINYTVSANNGADRTGTLNVAGRVFTITQTGLNCTYSISPTNLVIDRMRQSGYVSVVTQPGCTWSITGGSFVSITAFTGVGSGEVRFLAFENFSGFDRTDILGFFSLGPIQRVFVTQTATVLRRAKYDFDGDNKTDISVFRPGTGEWWINQSSSGQSFAARFGAETDILTPGDFTGDGRADIAFFRPTDGFWYILRSENGSFFSFPFGAPGDIPAPGDFDGDGKADPAVFRPSTGTWFISKSSGGVTIASFGTTGDRPVVADFDGDLRSDIAIYRPSVGEWWYQRSTDGQVLANRFGNSTDIPTPGDFTGDGRADQAFFRPATGEWFVLRSESFGSFFSFPFGANGDVPVAGDYDGDGRFDAGVFRPSISTWYVNRSTAGVAINSFGASGDQAVPAPFNP